MPTGQEPLRDQGIATDSPVLTLPLVEMPEIERLETVVTAAKNRIKRHVNPRVRGNGAPLIHSGHAPKPFLLPSRNLSSYLCLPEQ